MDSLFSTKEGAALSPEKTANEFRKASENGSHFRDVVGKRRGARAASDTSGAVPVLTGGAR